MIHQKQHTKYTIYKYVVYTYSNTSFGVELRLHLMFSIFCHLLIHKILLLQPPPAKYGGRHTVTLIPGDGIGPELLNHVREVFRLVALKAVEV